MTSTSIVVVVALAGAAAGYVTASLTSTYFALFVVAFFGLLAVLTMSL